MNGLHGASECTTSSDMADEGPGLELFATCPQSKDLDQNVYAEHVKEVAQWSERAGLRGILVYTDNGLVDPWLVAQLIIESTERLRPLVAVQPVYMHPYTVAKKVTSLGNIYGRSVDLNMVAGGFRNDLIALGDETPHDERYRRIVEYTLIVTALLQGESVSVDGNYYCVKNLSLTPPLSRELLPGMFISGSSDAGLAAARSIGATAVKYPKPPDEEQPTSVNGSWAGAGIRVGIIARADDADAWEVARARFPEDRKGQVTHGLAMKISDSQWHRHLSEMGMRAPSEVNPYWLGPFENYKTFCPYLVGSYDRVSRELARYLELGFGTFILDIPFSEEELEHTSVAFERALRNVDAARPVGDRVPV
jgi:alkanesulfonate monooxygenase